MPKPKRQKRSLSKKIVVYCEGDTEEHYLNGLRKWVKEHDPSIDIKIKSEPIRGGGYKSFYEKLKLEPDSNCVARVVLLDFDRYLNHSDERSMFEKIVTLSINSKKGRVPLILVGSCENFEYALCCHDPSYKDGNTDAFIEKAWEYSSVEDCKADLNIWDKVHKGKCSHEQALDHLNKRPRALKNDVRVVKSTYSIELKSVTFDEDELSGYGSNLRDLFSVIGVL